MDHLTRVLVLCGTPSVEYLNKINSSEVCVSYIYHLFGTNKCLQNLMSYI